MTVMKAAGDSYRMAFKLAIIAASYGMHGPAVEKMLQQALKKIEAAKATMPDSAA